MRKNHVPIPAGPGHLGTIGGPGDFVDAPRARFIQGMRPADFVAQTQSVEGADGKQLAVGGPRNGGNGVVVLPRIVQLTAECIPHSISTVFTS